jgi:hypothetical protein
VRALDDARAGAPVDFKPTQPHAGSRRVVLRFTW